MADDATTTQTTEEQGARIDELERQLTAVKILLTTMFGPSCLGGGPRPDAPRPEPEPKRLRPIATVAGNVSLVSS